jgi:hypothetical protein
MPCKNLRPQLALFAGGELDVVANLNVERHLRECAGCRQTADAFRAHRAALNRYGRDLSVNQGAPDLFSGVIAKLGGGRSVSSSAPEGAKAGMRRGDVLA